MEVVMFLVEHGADAYAMNNFGETPCSMVKNNELFAIREDLIELLCP